MSDETFGQRLQRLREEAGMSQPGLARAAAVPVASLRNWEQGRREPSVSISGKLAAALGVSLDVLAGLVDPPPSPPADQVEKPRRGRPATKTPATKEEGPPPVADPVEKKPRPKKD